MDFFQARTRISIPVGTACGFFHAKENLGQKIAEVVRE